MKRLIGILLCAVMAAAMTAIPAAAADSGGFLIGEVKSVALISKTDFTQNVRSVAPEACALAQKLLGSAGAAAARPKEVTELAEIRLGADSGTASFTLARSGSGFYLIQGTVCRPVKYDDFEALVRAVDGVYGTVSGAERGATAKFYRYAPIPGATYANKALAIADHNYRYKRLNGSFVLRSVSFDMEAPAFPLANGKLFQPSFYASPESAVYTVYKDGAEKPVWTGDSAQAATKTLDPGDYSVWVKTSYQNENYRGTVTYLYRLEGGGNPIDFSVEADHARPGEVVVVKVSGPDSAKAAATASTDVDFKPRFFYADGNTQIALLPVSVYASPGSHYVDVTCGEHSARLAFNAREKKFEVQHLTVEAATAEQTILSQRANAEYERVISPLRPVSDNKQYWSGRFILPTSDEKVTSSFGVIRYTNGSPTPSRHNALDFAVPRGTGVKASGAGRVLYAGYLQLTGNTVLIEHGFGLKSWYYHMDSLSVGTDEMVKQGQIIGTVGSTGFSTGPHMHFGMSVNNVFINPYTLINTDLLAKDFSTLPKMVPPSSRLTLKLDAASYPVHTSVIKGTVVNNTDQEESYGLYYKIERLENGKWTELPLKFEVQDIAVVLAPGKSGSISFNLYQNQYKYAAGKYRVTMTDGAGGASAEFTLAG